MGNDLRALKAMVSVMNPSAVKSNIFKGVKMPYKRKKETRPRVLLELKVIKPAIVKHLRQNGCRVWILENSIVGEENSSLTDLIVYNRRYHELWFAEVKTPTGRLSKGQIIFQEICKDCSERHVVLRSVEDCKIILKNNLQS